VVAAGAVPSQCLVEIFAKASFTGTSFRVAADEPRLSEYGWDKQISSLNVKSGTWGFYSEPDYGGQMMQLPPGQYANLEGWDKQISSLMCTQPVVAAGAVPGSAAAQPVTSAMAQGCLVEIYSQVALTGPSSAVAADQPRLSEYGWDKQISSLNVKSGTWDFYSEPDYGGQMMQLPPGQYANLEGWDKQISSLMCTQAE
jgi:hypothetical protein